MLNQNSDDDVRRGVLEELNNLFADRDKQVAIRDEMSLNSELGLSSLDLAELVAILEQRFKHDPFRSEVAITSVRTVADLCAAYRGKNSIGQQGDESLLAKALERAQSRRKARTMS